MHENEPAQEVLDPVAARDSERREASPVRRRRLIRFSIPPSRPGWKQARKRTRQEELEHRRRQRPLIAAELVRRGCSAKRAEAVARCRTRLVLVDPASPERARWTTSSCNHRACPSCTERRNLRRLKRIEMRLRREVRSGARLSFVTLTVRRVPGVGIAAARRKLRKTFATISRHEFYRRGVRGTVVKLEGHGSPDEGPHEHVHVLLVTTDADVPEKLRGAWRRATEDHKAVVSAQWVPIAEAGAVLAYLSKADDGSPAEIVDRAIALSGTHDLTLTGVLKVPTVPAPRPTEGRPRWLVVELEGLRGLAAAGHPWAEVAIRAAEARLR